VPCPSFYPFRIRLLSLLWGLKIGGGWVFEPLLIALAAAIGEAIGEFSGYLLGFGSRKAITGRYKKNVDFLIKVFNKYGSIAIFAFALTPLPDDLFSFR
jgi:membrane protein YqaA with SNARE-associated domain